VVFCLYRIIVTTMYMCHPDWIVFTISFSSIFQTLCQKSFPALNAPLSPTMAFALVKKTNRGEINAHLCEQSCCLHNFTFHIHAHRQLGEDGFAYKICFLSDMKESLYVSKAYVLCPHL
jgi:hypothetical protein